MGYDHADPRTSWIIATSIHTGPRPRTPECKIRYGMVLKNMKVHPASALQVGSSMSLCESLTVFRTPQKFMALANRKDALASMFCIMVW